MNPFIAQITLFAADFPPRGWAFCEGQLLDIMSYQALFSILGTTYGGDGRTTFALPDLRGRFALQDGSGPGLPPYSLGQHGGKFQVNLTLNQLPVHDHAIQMPCSAEGSDSDDPSNKIPGVANDNIYGSTADATMQDFNTGHVGVDQAVQVQNPYLALNFIIALVGTFPSRN